MNARLPRPLLAAARFVPALLLVLALQPGAVSAQPRWVEHNCGFTTPDLLHMPDVVDEYVVWVLPSAISSPSLEFSRTTDGGSTWIPGMVTVAAGSQPTAIEALNALTAWAGYKTTVFTRARIYKTTDGGTTWVLQSTAFNGSSSYINDIHFFDANNGVGMGDPVGGTFEIFTTTNGGTNWSRVPSANIPPPLTSEAGYPTSYDAHGDNIWFGTIGNGGRVFRSTDRGIHWTAAAVDPAITCITGLAFSDANRGLAVGHEHTGNTHKAARTTDGGVTWTALGGPANPCTFFLAWLPGTATFVTTNTYDGFVGGVGSAYSTDDGEHWTFIDQEYLGPVDFASATAGWCGGWTYQLGARPLPALELARPASCKTLVDECFPSTGTTPDDPRTRLVVLGGAWKWDESIVAVSEAGTALPERLAHRSYPNPFNPAATIEFTLPTASHARLRVYTSAGQEVATLVNGSLAAGRHAAHWDAAGKASGVYFYRLEAGGNMTSGRLVLAK